MEGIVKSILVDGKYQVLVSDSGHIYNMRGREYHTDNNSKGYARIGLSVTINGKIERRRYSVHRLVATAFIPNPQNFPQINHKDLCKTNNSVDNLEWCDQSYNIRHSRSLRKAGVIPPISENKQIEKSSGDYLKNKEWVNFLMSIPFGETTWFGADNNELRNIRNTATYLTRVNKELHFSIHRCTAGGRSFMVVKYSESNGNE